MDEVELERLLRVMMPFIKIEEKQAKPDRCKYMVGTLGNHLIMRANQVVLQVGGGFESLQKYIELHCTHECLKIFYHMRDSQGDTPEGERP